jgi:hypothetical protein
MFFHVVARGSASGGTWRSFPSEEWIVLNRNELNSLLPHGDPNLKSTWDAPPAVAAKLMGSIYPPTEDPEPMIRSRIESATFHFTMVTLDRGMGRARIDASVRMEHIFPGKPPGGGEPIDAKFLGFVDFSLAEHRIQRLRLVTESARVNNESFDGALRSVSRETLEAQGW